MTCSSRPELLPLPCCSALCCSALFCSVLAVLDRMAVAHAAGTCNDACSRLHPGELFHRGCIVPAAGPPSQHCDWASFPLYFSFFLFFFSGLLPLSFSLLSINIIITTDIDCPNTSGFYPLSQHHWLSAYLIATRISLPPTAHALARHTAVYHSREGELHTR